MLLANTLLFVHGVIVAITVAGAVAIFTGRFAKFHIRDYFAWAFLACSVGQLISLFLTGGYILTEWERSLRLQSDPNIKFSETFLQEYFPFLPLWFTASIPLLTLAATIGATVQIYFALRRRNVPSAK